MNKMTRAFFFLGMLSLVGTAWAISAIQIHNPWVRSAPPMSKILAGYMAIENNSDMEKVLIGATSPIFERIEFHKTIHEKGMAKMIRKLKIVIAPRSHIFLEPGGIHMMLISPRRSLRTDDQVPMTFQFQDKNQVKIVATVRKKMEETIGGKHQGGH